MSTEKIRQDATQSTRGTIYHLCVAVAKCYELREGQKVLVEELGDVTIEGDQQVEVKQYSGYLTDGHHNFWNTLKNWMDDGFDHTPYTSLILHTTQEFGPEATITEWNRIDTDKRLELLLAVKQRFEKAYEKSKEADPKRVVSVVLNYQRFILDPKRHTKLRALIGKVWIEAKAKELPDLYEELKQDRIRGVLSGKKNDYLNSLIGFVCRADKRAGERWEITYDQFNEKLVELTDIYRSETRIFPSKRFHEVGAAGLDEDREDLFVQKIRDIQYPEAIARAIHHYEAVVQTIAEEFGAYRTEPERLEAYSQEVEARFEGSYRRACRNCSDEIRDSQDFYDITLTAPPPDFPGFHDSPDWFRNGLLHMRMNDFEADYRWRLSKK